MKFSALVTAIVFLAASVPVWAKDKKPAQNKAQVKAQAGKAPVKDKGHKDKGHKDKEHKESQARSNAQLMQAFKVLQSTKITLEKADHNYGGHRAQAVVAIAKAQGSLNAALAGQQMKTPPAPNLKGWKKEPQKVSNAQLANSIKVLHKTIAALKHAKHDYHGFRAQAVADLEQAVRQLEVALKYQKKHGG